MQLKINKTLILLLILSVPAVGFAQYSYKELPINIDIPSANGNFDFQFRVKWACQGKFSSSITKTLQNELKNKALEVYEIIKAEQEKPKKNEKKIARDTRRYKLYKAMFEALDSIIEKKVQMEKLCYKKHKNTKIAQDRIYKQVQEESKRLAVWYAEIRSLEKR